MGRAAVLPYPTHGHIAPILGVVQELAHRGEDVAFYATGRSRAKIEAAGAQFRSYSRRHDAFNPTPPTSGLFADMARLAALSEKILPGLIEELRAWCPDYLLIDTKSFWGRIAGAVLGIPVTTLSVVFAIQPGSIPIPELIRLLYAGAPAGPLLEGLLDLSRYYDLASRIGKRFGVSSPGIIEYLGNPQPLNVIFTSRDFQVNGDSFGEHFEFVGPSIPAEREADGDFPWDLLDNRPLVYISLGTTFHDAPAFYRACLDAFAHEPCQVVLSTGGAEYELGPPPANFIVRRYVPQLALLRRAQVFITHGGMNSANEALWFGVPMLVVPQRGDQHLVAARVAELGAGLNLHPRGLTPDSLRSAVRSLLAESRYTERAGALGTSMQAAGGARRAADAILRASRRHAP